MKALRLILPGLVVLITAAAVSLARAGQTPWRVFATASDASSLATFANASGDVLQPKGLAARVLLSRVRSADLNLTVTCSLDIHQARSNKIYVISVENMRKCSVGGVVITDPGRVTLQLLRR